VIEPLVWPVSAYVVPPFVTLSTVNVAVPLTVMAALVKLTWPLLLVVPVALPLVTPLQWPFTVALAMALPAVSFTVTVALAVQYVV
jgi:hypothetical protein